MVVERNFLGLPVRKPPITQIELLTHITEQSPECYGLINGFLQESASATSSHHPRCYIHRSHDWIMGGGGSVHQKSIIETMEVEGLLLTIFHMNHCSLGESCQKLVSGLGCKHYGIFSAWISLSHPVMTLVELVECSIGIPGFVKM